MIDRNIQGGIMVEGDQPPSISQKFTNAAMDIGQSDGKRQAWLYFYGPKLVVPGRLKKKKDIIGAAWAALGLAREVSWANQFGLHGARSTNSALPHGESCFNLLIANQGIDAVDLISGKNFGKINNGSIPPS